MESITLEKIKGMSLEKIKSDISLEKIERISLEKIKGISLDTTDYREFAYSHSLVIKKIRIYVFTCYVIMYVPVTQKCKNKK